MPIGVMFCVDVWIMVTIGQSTTTAIKIKAGAIQGSGPRRRTRPAGRRRRAGPGEAACPPAVSLTAVLSDKLPQPPLSAVCWIALRICCGLPVMACPSVVLI
jgi:hypothetical protein